MNGAAIKQLAAPGDPNWAYESDTNEILFYPQAVPGAGAAVDVTFPIGCE